jgi:hypothetical protein
MLFMFEGWIAIVTIGESNSIKHSNHSRYPSQKGEYFRYPKLELERGN